jgi:hypothetical protein
MRVIHGVFLYSSETAKIIPMLLTMLIADSASNTVCHVPMSSALKGKERGEKKRKEKERKGNETKRNETKRNEGS